MSAALLGQSGRLTRAFGTAGAVKPLSPSKLVQRNKRVSGRQTVQSVTCMATAAGSGLKRADEADKVALVDKVDCFIFDCDGVIWKGDSVIDGVPETLEMLRAAVSTCWSFFSVAPSNMLCMHIPIAGRRIWQSCTCSSIAGRARDFISQ